MKYLILILLLSSCYTKNQAIKKFCSKDTASVMVTIHDTIIVDSIQTDSTFDDSVSYVYIVKDRLEIKYIKKFGKVYIQGKCKGDTIYYEKKVLIEIPVNCPKLSWYKQYAADYWWLWPLLISMYFGIAYFHKLMNNG